MMGLRWVALGVLWIPLAEAPRECPPPPRFLSPLEVLLGGGGVLGSLLILRRS